CQRSPPPNARRRNGLPPRTSGAETELSAKGATSSGMVGTARCAVRESLSNSAFISKHIQRLHSFADGAARRPYHRSFAFEPHPTLDCLMATEVLLIDGDGLQSRVRE